MLCVLSDMIETTTMDEGAKLLDLSAVRKVSLLPNANLDSDGVISGCVVEADKGYAIPRLLGKHISETATAIKTKSKVDEVNTDLLNIILSGYIEDGVNLIEVGACSEDYLWVLVVVSGREFKVGKQYKAVSYEKYTGIANNSLISSVTTGGIIAKNVITALGCEVDETFVTPINTILSNGTHLSNARVLHDGLKSIILGSHSEGFALAEGVGYCPTTCGRHINFPLARDTMDGQARRFVGAGVITNASYYESPDDYRNLSYILDELPDVRIVETIKPIINIKG